MIEARHHYHTIFGPHRHIATFGCSFALVRRRRHYLMMRERERERKIVPIPRICLAVLKGISRGIIIIHNDKSSDCLVVVVEVVVVDLKAR